MGVWILADGDTVRVSQVKKDLMSLSLLERQATVSKEMWVELIWFLTSSLFPNHGQRGCVTQAGDLVRSSRAASQSPCSANIW